MTGRTNGRRERFFIIGKSLILLGVDADAARAGALRTPAHLVVVGKQTRIGFRKTDGAHRAGSLGGQDFHGAFFGFRQIAGIWERLATACHAHQPVTVEERFSERLMNLFLGLRLNLKRAGRHFKGVLFVARQQREG